MAYTYDDFQKAASGSNVNFSQYDLDLAKKYPEFGMSVLDLKKQYAGATTAEQRALINAKAALRFHAEPAAQQLRQLHCRRGWQPVRERRQVRAEDRRDARQDRLV